MAQTKTDDGKEYPSSAYAYVPDPDKPSTWKLRLWETPESKVTATQVGRAVAALGSGGFMGNKVQLPSDALAGVKRKVLAAWHSVHDAKTDDVPEILKGVEKMETMTLEDLTKKVTDLSTDLSEATKRADRSEKIIKLSPEDRATFDTLTDTAKQDEFLDGDENVRKAMMPEDMKGKKGKKPPMADDEPDGDEPVGKSAGEVELEKKLDEVQKQLDQYKIKTEAAENIAKQERETRLKVEFEKKAETEYPALPGTAIEKGAVLQVIASKLSTEEAAGVHKLLAAGNEALKQLGVSKGSDAPVDSNDAWTKIDNLAKGLVTKDSKMTHAKAVQQVITENPKLYEEYLNSQK